MTPFTHPARRLALVLVLLTLFILPGGLTLDAGPLAQSNVVRFGGALTPTTDEGANGDTISFDVTYDANDVPIFVDFQLTISSLVMSEEEGPLCATGAQSNYQGDTTTILPWPDPRPMYTFTGDVQPGGVYPRQVSITGLLGRSLEGNYIGPENSEGTVTAFYEVSAQGSSFTIRCMWTWDLGEGAGGVLAFSQAGYEIGENQSSATITVVRTDKIVGAVTVDYATANQTATAGQDYTSASGTLSFADGESQKSFTVDILPDDLVEGEETLGLTLANPTGGATLGTPAAATLTIDDTPDLAVLAYNLDDFSLVQSGTTFTLKDVLVKVTNVFDENGETVPLATVQIKNGGTVIHSATVGPLVPGGPPQEITFDWDVTDLLVNGGGMANLSASVVIDPGGAIPDRNPGNNAWPGGREISVLPIIEKIQPQYEWAGGFFLQGVPLNNKIDVTINDWNGDAQGQGEAPFGKVHFKLNQDQTTVLGKVGKNAHTYDMGADLTKANECAANILVIRAEGIDPAFVTDPSPPLAASAVSLPEWVDWVKVNLETYDLTFATQAAGKTVDYRYGFAFPNPAFGPAIQVPAGVPVLGGATIGFVPPTVATIDTVSNSGGPGTVGLTGQTGFTAPLLTASGDLFGTGETRFRCMDGFPVLDFDSVTFGFLLQHEAASGEVTMENMLPGVGNVLGAIPYWGPELAANFNASTVGVAMNVGGGFQFTVSEQGEGELEFESARGTAQMELAAAADIMLLDELSLSVSGGGTPYVRVKVPRPPPDFLEEVGINLAFEAAYQIWAFDGSFSAGATCSLPGGCSLTQGQLALLSPDTLTLDPGWHVLPSVADGPDYAVFQPEIAHPGQAAQQPSASVAPGESIRVTNVYTFPAPSLAVDGSDKALVAYVHADPADPPGLGTELRSQSWGGAGWRGDMVGSVAQQPDFSPAVAYRTITDTVIPGMMVWERAYLPPGISPSLDITFTSSLEILAAGWDGSAWAAPTRLSTNTLMDRSPQLAPGADGTILALWQTGKGDSFGGAPANPIDLTYALWNGSTWTAPAVGVAGVVDVRQVRAASRSATEAALVLAKGDGPGTDTELYASTFNGTAWTALQPVTANAIPDNSPALAYDSSGRRHLVWLENGELRWLVDSWTGSAATVPIPHALTGPIQDLALSAGPDGRLALTWQSGLSAKPGIAYSLYDPATNGWSAPIAAAEDASVESALSAALAADGRLHIAYAKAETTLVTRTLTLTTGQTITVPNVTALGKRDLAVLTIAPGTDLTWDSLALSPANPVPGQPVTLTGVLRNAGPLTASAPRVRVFDGTTALSTLDLGDLGGGYTRTVTVPATLGGQNGPHTLRAVADPDGQLAESDETNNERSLITSLPNLRVTHLGVAPSSTGLTVTATIRNDGVQATGSGFQVSLRADNPVTGALLASADVSALAPGETDVVLAVDGVNLPSGGAIRLWAEADALAQVMEQDETDNRRARTVDLLPDLAIAAEDLSIDSGELRVVVHNRSMWDTPTGGLVWVGVGDVAPTAATALFTATLGAVPGGGEQILTFPVSAGAQIFAVGVDGSNLLAEMDEANNLAFRRLTVGRSRALYLPTIMR